MVDTTLIIGISGIAAGLIIAVGGVLYARQDQPGTEEQLNELVAREGDDLKFKPPEIGSSILGLLALWQHKGKEKRMARKGYVKWRLLGSTMSRPRWVKPSEEGSGVPEYKHKGDKYYFPKDAMVIDETSGAYVAIHEKGSSMPLNLQDPPLPPVPVDLLQRVIDLEAESEAPGWLSGLSITPKKLLWGFIGFILIFSLVMQVMGGGV